ncbi:MAG: methyltransferase domain-containing protein [Candidatus Marinimicrobia bacterium]|nr:methyltransferase domain-containing protein [Candidatus Neomarinimicrobiota bacterium]
MSHKFNPEGAERLVSPERYQELKPDILLQRLGIPPGCTILDLGCGNGFFTFPAAVGMGEQGMVIAADTSEEMLTLLNRRIPPDNVQVLQVDEIQMDLESDSVDAAVVISLYHELKTPRKNLKEIKRVLRAEGKIMLLDWDPVSEQKRGPRQDHRILQSQVIEDLTATGFKINSSENYVEDIWMIIAQLPA